MDRLDGAEQRGCRASSWRQQLDARAGGGETRRAKATEEESEELEALQEAKRLRESLHSACKSLQCLPNDERWAQGLADLGGQILLQLSSIGELSASIQAEEAALEADRAPRSLEELQEEDAAAEAEVYQARYASAMVRLHQEAYQQSTLQQEVAELRSHLRSEDVVNEHLTTTCRHLSEALADSRSREQEMTAEVHAAVTAEVSRQPSASSVLQALLPDSDKEATKGSASQLLAATLRALAAAQRRAAAHEAAAAAWRRLAATSPALKCAPRTTSRKGRAEGPSSEPGSKPVTLALSGRLEAYVSQLGAQLREGHAVRQRAALSVPGPSNAQEGRKATERQLEVWRKELFKTCAAWLPERHSDQLATARELALEVEVEELAGRYQASQDRLALLSQPSHARFAPSCQRSRQQVSALESQLSHTQRELQAVLARVAELEAELERAEAAKASEAQRSQKDAQQICPALVSLADQLQQMSDARKRSQSGSLVLEDLAKTKRWCEQVQADLQQANLSELNTSDLDGSVLGMSHDSTGSSSAVLHRVEALLGVQHELYQGYRNVTREIHELQLKKQAQEHRLSELRRSQERQQLQLQQREAQEEQLLQKQLDARRKQLEECQKADRWRGEAEEVAAGEATLRAAATRDQRLTEAATAEMAELAQAPMLPALQTAPPGSEVRRALAELRFQLGTVQGQLQSGAVRGARLAAELAAAQHRGAELRRRGAAEEAEVEELKQEVHALSLASSAACERRDAETRLEESEEEMEQVRGQFQHTSKACQELAEGLRAARGQAREEQRVAEELENRSNFLESALHRAEARLHTQDRRFKQEREEWHRKLRALQQSEANMIRDSASELHEASALKQKEAEAETLAGERAELEAEARRLSSELELAKRQGAMQAKEAEAAARAAQRDEEVLLKEISSARGRITAMAKEIDRLREAKPPSGGMQLSASSQDLRAQRSEQAKTKQVQRLLAQEEKQEAGLKEKISASKTSAVDLRERVKEAEQRLRTSREDVERKKALVAALQKRCQEDAQQSSEEMHLEEESARALQQTRRDLARKEAAIKHLQSEAEEAKAEPESESGVSTAGAKLKAEMSEKDQALHHAEAKLQLVKVRLAEQMSSAKRLSMSSGSFPLRSNLRRSQQSWTETSLHSASLDASRNSDVLALEQELSGILEAGSLSSWEESAVRESLEILNLQPKARIRAKEKRKKVKKSEKLRKEREAAQAAKAAKAEAKAKEKEAKAARAPPGQAKRGRPRKAPLAPQGVAESEPGDSQEQASQQIEDPALSAPRRPTLLEVPSTPIDQLPPLEGLAPEEVQRLSRQEPSVEPGASCGPPPSCVTAFASLMRYVTEDLPAETSARRNAVAKVARHLGTHLPLQDVNQLLRQVQLQMMEKSGLSASRLAPAKAAQVEAMPAEGPELGLLPGVEPETESLKAVCKFIERHPLSGSRDSMKDFRTFVAELVSVESPEWQAAWQLGLGKLPDQERDRANLMLVTTMLAFSTDPDADRRERLSKALADFVRSHKVKLRTLEEAVVDAVDQVQGCFRYLSELEQVISSLLAYLYPAASNAGYGWRRPGWSFADWMRMVEKLLGRLEETAAVELLERTLYLLEASWLWKLSKMSTEIHC
ncbi:unnamed protein product [Effrenium voratum]|uniref:Uncharacterized protein n=1 Tax=Effrenium voratum TaxID=2562239 RepID=A0AA36JKE5_9DINO|nr:unnamed protein product [Effrenium voratum]